MLHAPVINFDRINLTLFLLIYLQRKFWEIVRQIKWNQGVLFYNNNSVGIVSLLTDLYFQSLSRHPSNAYKYFMRTMTNN